MPRPANADLRAYWRDLIQRQQTSGLSIPRFCVKEGVHYSRFYIWRQRFRLMDTTGSCPAEPARATFLPVAVRVADSPAHQPLSIEADLPNGIRLRIPTANARLSCRLVRALARATTNSGGSR
jgi:hypothetical protein